MANPLPNAKSHVLPSPTGGWNTRDPLILMPEQDAIILDNVIPGSSFCRARSPYKQWAYLGIDAVLGNDSVHTLANLSMANGTEKLLAVSNDKIWDATIGSSPANIKGAATVTPNTSWQHVTFRNRLFLVNGTNQPLDWTGSGNVTLPVFTGSGGGVTLTPANLINVSAYKFRLYFLEKLSSRIWYAEAVNNVAGALVPFDYQGLLTRGGNILYAGPTSQSSSGQPNSELFCAVSNQGEVLIYAGDNPKSGTWEIVGHYYIGRAIGYRCCFHVGGDLHIITSEGVVPVSQLLQGLSIATDENALSSKIKPSFVEMASQYSGNHGWIGCYHSHSAGPYAVVNIPIQDYGNSYQFVFNTVTKAWCRWIQANAHSWVSWKVGNQVLLMFGTNEGKIYIIDDQLGQQDDDEEVGVPIDVQHAYSWLGAPQVDKVVQFVQPYFFLGQNQPQPAGEEFNLGALFDFDEMEDPTELPQFNFRVAEARFPTSGANNREILDIGDGSGGVVSIRYAARLRNDGALTDDRGVWFRHYATKIFYTAGSEIA